MMTEKEKIEIVKKYKRKISNAFVLIDGTDINSKISGSEFVVTKKLDGALQGIFFENDEIVAITTHGKVHKDLPCLKEAAKALKDYGLKSAVIEAELYAVLDGGKRERVGDVASALADKTLWDKLHLAPFDITELDGEEFNSNNYNETIKKLYSIFKGELVKPVEYKELSSTSEIVELYKEWVEDGGAEGIVVHSELPIIYKVKTHHTIDAAIIGFTYSNENDESIRDIAIAVEREDETFQIIGVTGNGFTSDQRKELAKKLKELACESEYIMTDSRNVAFQMVKPQIVGEFSVEDIVPENSDDTPKINPLLIYDENKGFVFDGNTPGASLLHLVFVRFRDDKSVNSSDVRISQITDICPFSEGKQQKFNNLSKSEIIAKRVFTKGSGEKLMIQKYLVWKTNKEESGMFPAYVFFYTDFSSGRKDMLKRDLKVTSNEKQALSFMDQVIEENVKKGWQEAL